jgi:uncharacterized protein
VNVTTQTIQRSAEQLVAELFQIIDAREWDRLGTVFTDDCVYWRPGYEPCVGLDRIEHFYRYERIIAAGAHEVECVASDIGAAACWGRLRGENHSGAKLDERFADTYQLRDGKIAVRRTFFFRAAI